MTSSNADLRRTNAINEPSVRSLPPWVRKVNNVWVSGWESINGMFVTTKHACELTFLAGLDCMKISHKIPQSARLMLDHISWVTGVSWESTFPSPTLFCFNLTAYTLQKKATFHPNNSPTELLLLLLCVTPSPPPTTLNLFRPENKSFESKNIWVATLLKQQNCSYFLPVLPNYESLGNPELRETHPVICLCGGWTLSGPFSEWWHAQTKGSAGAKGTF